MPSIMKLFQDHVGESMLLMKGSLLFLIGPLNAQLSYVVLAIVIDLLFGMRVAAKEKVFSWSVFTGKVGNKIFVYTAWISLFNALDMVAGLPNTARNAVILVLISMEIFSASKNTAKLGYGKLASLMENVYFLITKDNPVAQKQEVPPAKPVEENQEGSDNNDGTSL